MKPLFGALVLVGALVVPIAATHAESEAPPASRCITSATQVMYATMIAQEKKDIAPYRDVASMEAAIKTYQENIDTAWEAMGDPYCGYGSYGAKSAIHSFQKTAERVRGAFLERVAQYRKTGTVSAIAPVVTPPVTTSDAPVPTTKVPEPPATSIVTTAVVPASVTGSIARGLHEGMRGDSVLQLQRLLATIQKIALDDPYITGYFGAMTKKRLIKFQLDKGIIDTSDAPGAGQVGPRTAAALNKLK